jgi:outer membrane murein-binding lipoprotein Lpp
VKTRLNNFIRACLRGVDIKRLKRGDEKELSRFRGNLAIFIKRLFTVKPEQKQKVISTIKTGSLELISQIPVITPVITAMFQVITGEDLGSKMDGLASKMDGLASKIDDLGNKLSSKIDGLSSKIDDLGNKLGSKMDNINDRLGELLQEMREHRLRTER